MERRRRKKPIKKRKKLFDDVPKTQKKRRRTKEKTEPNQPLRKNIFDNSKYEWPKFKLMISVEDELPPDTKEPVLTWDPVCEYEINVSFVSRQHIEYDFKTLGYSRVKYWFNLRNM